MPVSPRGNAARSADATGLIFLIVVLCGSHAEGVAGEEPAGSDLRSARSSGAGRVSELWSSSSCLSSQSLLKGVFVRAVKT